MAKKATSAVKTPAKKTVVSTTPVRNSAVPPRPATPAAKAAAPTFEQIATRAYHIWQQTGNAQDDNWFQAERELHGV